MVMEKELSNFVSRPVVTRWQSLVNRAFPYIPCPHPKLKGCNQQDELVVIAKIHLDIWDRLKVLFTGKLEVQTNTATEFQIGQSKGETVVRVGKFWNRFV